MALFLMFGQRLGVFNSNFSYLNPHLSCTVCEYADLPMNTGLIWTSVPSLSCVHGRRRCDGVKDGRSRVVHSKAHILAMLKCGCGTQVSLGSNRSGWLYSFLYTSECVLSRAIKKLICDGGEDAILGLKREKQGGREGHIGPTS